MAPPTDITFLIPAYNEARTIGDVLDGIAALGLDYEAIVVDDGSTDATAAIVSARETPGGRVRLLRKPNGGKGTALRHGIPHCRGEIVVVQDADMEYDPRDVPALIEPIERDAADVVYGSRLSGGRPQRAYLFWHMVGNKFLSLLTGVLFNTTLTDMETGYKAFSRRALSSLRLTENRFGIEPEITGEVCRRRMRVYEIPISYYGRTHAEGKNITWRDGFRAVFVLARTRLRPLRAADQAAVPRTALAPVSSADAVSAPSAVTVSADAGAAALASAGSASRTREPARGARASSRVSAPAR
ncbi:MAG TPA: glycosyltransferase family 2 protein [Solirubrobacteraceae bacterium]|nr:glycosyltransferase family 2 protein [Solirubrobacteraceae bacterium]